MKKYKYIVQYLGEFGKHIASYDAYDAEDLAEQFFKDHKHVDYEILLKEVIS